MFEYYQNPHIHSSYEQNVAYRTTQLNRFGEMYLNGQLISKIDHIASVSLTNGKHFNVYRRYNSDFCIILEDQHFNYLAQTNMSIRQSIGTALSLSDEEQDSIQCIQISSIRHNMAIPDPNPLILRWSEVQDSFAGITILLAYTPNDQQSQVDNEINNEIVYEGDEDENEYIAPIPSSPQQQAAIGHQEQQQEAPQQTPAFRLGKKRRRSELELLEPLPYNLRNKKHRM